MADKPKILICDDEETVRESLKVLLEDEYEIVLAEDGQKALDYIEEQNFNLAILDIKMPKMDGISVLKHAKDIKPDLKVIMLTGYSSVELAKDAVSSGAFDYIIKPFDKDTLLGSIKKSLSL